MAILGVLGDGGVQVGGRVADAAADYEGGGEGWPCLEGGEDGLGNVENCGGAEDEAGCWGRGGEVGELGVGEEAGEEVEVSGCGGWIGHYIDGGERGARTLRRTVLKWRERRAGCGRACIPDRRL